MAYHHRPFVWRATPEVCQNSRPALSLFLRILGAEPFSSDSLSGCLGTIGPLAKHNHLLPHNRPNLDQTHACRADHVQIVSFHLLCADPYHLIDNLNYHGWFGD